MEHQKPYYSLNQYYFKLFGQKTAKITIDGGFSCPNRQGREGSGCRFCSAKGSGDFTAGPHIPISEQIRLGKERMRAKWPNARFIAYFQAYTNTYAPVAQLRQKYMQAISSPDICGIAIATRPDCLPDDVVELLAEMSQKLPLWIELGLQTVHERTARAMHIGYTANDFEKAVKTLHINGIQTIAHVILGLPGETKKDMLETISFLNSLPISGVKLQLLHVLRNTPLAEDYAKGLFQTLTQQEYIDIIVTAISMLRPDIVIHRLTGDGSREDLIAPLWSLSKSQILNQIHHTLKIREIRQGQLYKNENLLAIEGK